jgi:hypothetical protein
VTPSHPLTNCAGQRAIRMVESLSCAG